MIKHGARQPNPSHVTRTVCVCTRVVGSFGIKEKWRCGIKFRAAGEGKCVPNANLKFDYAPAYERQVGGWGVNKVVGANEMIPMLAAVRIRMHHL